MLVRLLKSLSKSISKRRCRGTFGLRILCVKEKNENSKSIVFILLGIAWLVAALSRGLAVPVLARFSVGDPVVMGFAASTLAAILLQPCLYYFKSSSTRSQFHR